MIKTLTVKNFQSHKESNLIFCDGVNIIIGKSDSGKTAILRALRWVIWNRPSGDAFRSNWGGDTEVTIETTEKNLITRAKNRENLYQLNDCPFKAFSTDVPKEIQDALNINETNFQTQFDQPFLLTSTAGEVAIHFNKIAHIDKINSSIKKIQSTIRGIEQSIKTEEVNQEQYEDQLKQFDNLEKFEIDIDVLEDLENVRKNQIQFATKCQKLITDIEAVQEEIEESMPDEELEISIDSTLTLYADVDLVSKEIKNISGIVISIESIEEQIKETKTLLEVGNLIDPILTLYSDRDAILSQISSMKITITSIESASISLDRAIKALNTTEKSFHDNMPNECPLCGTQLSKA